MFTQLISNPDSMVNEESMRAIIEIQELLEQENKKNFQLPVVAIHENGGYS